MLNDFLGKGVPMSSQIAQQLASLAFEEYSDYEDRED